MNHLLAEQIRAAKARTKTATTQAGSPKLCLVAYDVNGIQEYVTANSRPVAMRGASNIIKTFDDSQLSAGALFAGGGRGLLLVPEVDARKVVERLKRDYAEASVTGVLGVATVPWDPENQKASIQWLKLKLHNAKDGADPPRDDRPSSKDAQCVRCRMYAAVIPHVVGTSTENVCRRCYKTTCEGQRAAGETDQGGLSLVHLSKNGYVAAVSADGNNMGRLFDAVDSLEATAALSAAITWAFAEAHTRALRAAKVESRMYVAPITGGDDIRVFFAPQHVEPYVTELASALRENAESFGDFGGVLNRQQAALARNLGIGVGVAVARDAAPASWMLQRAHDLERSAKSACVNGCRSALNFSWVSTDAPYLSGRQDGRTTDAGKRPLSLDGDSWPHYLSRVRELGFVPTSQRAVLARRSDLTEEEFNNLFLYQLARSSSWQRWYEKADVNWQDRVDALKHMPDANMLEMLRMLKGEVEQ